MKRTSLLSILAAGTFVAIAITERKRPLRARVESPLPHAVRDLMVGAVAAISTTWLRRALLRPLLEDQRHRERGLVNMLTIPAPARILAGVLLLDYTLWAWHLMNHRVPFLWRFHRVHHVDLDLDSWTGLRFHFGEMALSVPFRTAQVVLIGPHPLALEIWQWMVMISIAFHHSNIRLDERTDEMLSRFIVTPRMHGIHHSDIKENTDCNWSSLFTFWDTLHGTMRRDVPQEAITIGVPAYQHTSDVTIGKILILPIRETAEDWKADQ